LPRVIGTQAAAANGRSSRLTLIKQDFLEMEERWLSLAHSYEFAERLSRFTAPFRKPKQQKK
jgi:hypothetical protein